MNDMTALAQKLQALAQTDDVFEKGARVISSGGAPAPLLAMLQVIDDTILERTLEFAAGDTTVRLVAAGRRLRGFSAVTSDAVTDDTLIGQTISREEPDMLDVALSILSDAFDTAPTLTVRSLPPDPFAASGERGVPATDLMELWQITPQDTAPLVQSDTQIGAFLQTASAMIPAMLHVSGGAIVATSGDAADLQRIWQQQVDGFLKNQAKMVGPTDAPRLLSLEGVMPDGSSAALALDGDEIALVMHKATDLGGLHTAWQKTYS